MRSNLDPEGAVPIQDDQYRSVGMRRDPGYRPPSGRVGLSGAPPMPAGNPVATYEPTGRMYSAGPSHNESDQLSSFMASVPLSSPWARFQEDRGRQHQIDANVSSIAGDRSASRYYAPASQGPIGMKPSTPAPVAMAPATPGEQSRIDARNARYAMPSPPMAGGPRPPTLIPDPSKPGVAGASAAAPMAVRPFVERLRPPTPSPSRRQVMGVRNAQPQPQAPAPVQGDQARAHLTGHFEGQMAEALAKGDMNAFAELAAQKGALDSGGYVGLQNHVDERSMARAKLQEVGARVGLTNSKSGQAATPEEAAAAMFGKTGNQDAADHAAFLARRTAKQFNPEDAGRILEAEYPSTKNALAAGPDGRPTSDLHEMYANLKAINPAGFNDPNSDFSRAAKARIAQMFGSELPGQLFVPVNPREYGGPFGRRARAIAANAMGGHFSLYPSSDYDRRSAAAEWFNAK